MPASRHRSRTAFAAAAATVAVSALALTACGTTSSSSSSGSAKHHRSTSHGVHAAGVAKVSGNHTGAGSHAAAAHTTAPGTGTGTHPSARATPRCHTKDLAVSFETGGDAAPDITSDAQQQAGIAVRNSSGHTCVVGGFPGVDLKGGATTWSLSRKAATYSGITLTPGDTTDFQITFLPEPKGSWTPRTVTVTPPNETTSKTVTWPWGPVLLQDGATHPGTYVGPIG